MISLLIKRFKNLEVDVNMQMLTIIEYDAMKKSVQILVDRLQ